MKLEIERLNADSSILFTIDDKKILFDPWLVDSEVDGYKLFNEAWHTDPCLPVSDVMARGISAICISLPFADHCHIGTLEGIDNSIPIICSVSTEKVLKRSGLGSRKILVAPSYCGNNETFCEFKGLSFSSLEATGLLDFTHGGMIVRHRTTRKRSEHILYAPHGICSNNTHLADLQNLNWALVCVTFTEYWLPALLGGTVNLGVDEAMLLLERLRPRFVVDIHSERKAARGLVPLLARPSYALLEDVQSCCRGFVPLETVGIEKRIM